MCHISQFLRGRGVKSFIDMMVVYTGSYPPDVCGVGDYTFKLVEELRVQAEQVDVFKSDARSFFKFLKMSLLALFKGNKKLIIQYPTAGYGKSLMPHLVCVLGRVLGFDVVVTLHEFSTLSAKARVAAKLFFAFSSKIVFTHQGELDALGGGAKSKSVVIPIASNIPEANPAAVKSYDMGYFGMIAPGKGIEDFISVCRAMPPACKAFIMGQIPHYFKDYADEIIRECQKENIDILLGKSPEEVAEYLSVLRFAVLPFPDGLSPRRGSALAAMLNSALVVSYRSPEFGAIFDDLVVPCSGIEDMKLKVASLVSDGFDGDKIAKAKEYARALSWAGVARKYIEL